MDMTLSQALILSAGAMLAGIVLLVKGGDWTVDSSVFIARKLGISPLLVGFTIIAFGTSLPELIVSILANLEGSPGIALGNVLGSNIANILFVIGLCAIFTPLVTKSKAVLKDLTMMLAATVLLGLLLFSGEIGRLAGLGMVAVLIVYVSLQYKMAKSGEMPPPEEDEPGFSKPAQAYGFLAMGLVGIALGAQFLVHGAKTSALIIGVPDAVIGLSVIALGTSLPELSTSIIAGRKGHSDMVLGNIIGSNVFNILMIIGLTAIAKPIVEGSFAPQLVSLDIWIVGLVSVMFAGLLLFYNRISKPVGFAFMAGYVIYNIYIYAIYIGS
ncbi:MAG: calcium/sodium antiporter [Alphaproteobacteria bacterium]|nr:calcium/sodium antiporter [Alphaproteobacteria bacterium]